MSIPSPSLPQTHSSSSPPLAFTSTVDIQQLIQDYNQCGARLLQAECLQQAHDLFRAALYLHVLAETGTSGNASVIHDTPDHVWGLAELHVAHEREYLKHHHNAQSPTSIDVEDATMEDVCDSSSGTVSPLTTVSTTRSQAQHFSYRKIRSQAFSVDSVPIAATSCSLPSGIIHIFNLALCHQLKDAHSTKARIFLRNGPDSIVRLAEYE